MSHEGTLDSVIGLW